MSTNFVAIIFYIELMWHRPLNTSLIVRREVITISDPTSHTTPNSQLRFCIAALYIFMLGPDYILYSSTIHFRVRP